MGKGKATMGSLAEQKLWGALNRDHLLAGYPRLGEAARQRLVWDLQAALPPDALLLDAEQLITYSFDATGERHRPDAVVLPTSREEVVAAMVAARASGAYVIGRGAATNLSGGTMPIVGGLVVSLARMTQIRQVDIANRLVVVEPGVVNGVLQDRLRAEGFFYPPDPSSHRISTLGGNVAENSGGPHCVKYGVTTNHVLGAEMVTVDGEVVDLPTTRDARTGYDLMGLITGSEGTMGILTALTLAISPLPVGTQTMLAVFGSVDAALRCVSAVIAAKIVPATLELLDKRSIDIIQTFVPAGYPAGAQAVLLMEVDGSPDAVRAETAVMQAIAFRQGAVEFRLARSAAEAEALWKGRRAHYGASARLAPHLWVQDVTVPRPLLAQMMRDVLAIGERYGFAITTAAHAGDGNLHPVIPYDPENVEEIARMRQADQEILRACVRHGGAITGEHGIGIDKVDNLHLMYGEPELAVMMALKQVFDPARRLNPLKAVPVPARPLEFVPAQRRLPPGTREIAPDSAADVAALVAAAREQGLGIEVAGCGTRRHLRPARADTRPVIRLDTRNLSHLVDFDPDNLTCEVQAGMLAADLALFLAESGLELPGIESFSAGTIGGLVAANARYWRYAYELGWRDTVMGVEWVDGRGQILRFGRKTTKNVAGFDVAKLAVGSWGTLGVITKLILRLRPLQSPRQLGVVESADVPALLAAAATMSRLPVRPQGMAVMQTGSPTGAARLVMVAQGPETAAIRHAVAARIGEGLVNWHQDPVVWQSVEGGRLARIRDAVEGMAYTEGRVLPSQLDAVSQAVPKSLAATFFPGSGCWEVYGVAAAVPGRTRLLAGDGVQTVLTEANRRFDPGVRQVFDPGGVFGF